MTRTREETALWTCANGDSIRICDMDDQHLSNTIALIERQALQMEGRIIHASNPYRGEMAAEDFDQRQMDVLEDGIDPSEYEPLYITMLRENIRRTLRKS